MTKALSVLVMSSLLLGGAALGHAGGEHLMGRLKSVEKSSLSIETKDGKQATVHVDEKTKFEKSGAPATAQELVAGERVVVHAMKHGDMLHATLVKFGKQTSSGKSEATKQSSPTDGGTHEPHKHEHANH